MYFDEFDNPDLALVAPFMPTDEAMARALLELGEVNENDVLYDLGSGDGSIVVLAASEFGARGVGIELDPQRLRESRELASFAGVESKVEFREEDLFEANIREATVVTLYLLPDVHIALKSRLLHTLAPGSRVLSHSFNLGQWRPDKTLEAGGLGLYKWVVPAQVSGRWQWYVGEQRYELALEQRFQKLVGKAWLDGEGVKLTAAHIRGKRLTLEIGEGKNKQRLVFRYIDSQQLAPTGGAQAGQVSHAVRIMA